MKSPVKVEQSGSRGDPWKERPKDVIDKSLDHLLAMAQQYAGEGKAWQAMEIYWTLSEDHGRTAQGREAQRRLLEMAESYERDDARHLARAVYQRLSG